MLTASIKGQFIERASAGAAGFDLKAAHDFSILPGERQLVCSGTSIALQEGYYGKIESRSSLAVKFRVDTKAGVIDSDYRGPIKVCLANNGNTVFEGMKGDRIAQLIVQKYYAPIMVEVEELPPSERGEKGFGSTGR